MWLDERMAREATAGSADETRHMAFDGKPIPVGECETHPSGCPPLVTHNGIEFRAFPGQFWSRPRVQALLRLYALRVPPSARGGLLWSPIVAQAYEIMGRANG